MFEPCVFHTKDLETLKAELRELLPGPLHLHLHLDPEEQCECDEANRSRIDLSNPLCFAGTFEDETIAHGWIATIIEGTVK